MLKINKFRNIRLGTVKPNFLLLFCLFFLSLSVYAGDTPHDPVTLISSKDKQLQKILKVGRAKKSYPIDTIKVLINGIFDFEELAKKSLGKKDWDALSPDKQKRFTKAFKGMVENASVKKLEAYESDSTVYDKPEVEGNSATVTANAFAKGTKTILTYKLHKVGGQWKAWDLVIDDLSTQRNYKEQFRKILETKSMDDLIAILEKKANESSTPQKADSMKAKSEKAANQAAISGEKAKPDSGAKMKSVPKAKVKSTAPSSPATTTDK